MMKISDLRDIAIKEDFYGATALSLIFACAFGIMLEMAGCGKHAVWLVSIPIATAIGLAVKALHGRSKSKIPAWVIYVVVAALLAAAFAVFHTEIIQGIIMMINRAFDAGEKSQSYVYERISADVSWDEASAYASYACAWTGSAMGFFAAFAPARDRRWLIVALPILVIALAAFFGIQPSPVWAFVMIAIACIAVPGSSLKCSWPLLVAVALIFSAAAFAGPGKLSAVSETGDQIRDILAVQTAGHERSVSQDTLEEEKEEPEEEGGGLAEFFNGNDVPQKTRRLRIVIALMLLTALILFVPAVIHDRLEKKRRAIRGDIGSDDPTDAVRAMFPYTVRWLAVCGLALSNKSFADYDADIRQMESDSYADEYTEMYKIWRQAAYSSLPVSEADRASMKDFMDKTIDMVKEKTGLRGKLDIRFRRTL